MYVRRTAQACAGITFASVMTVACAVGGIALGKVGRASLAMLAARKVLHEIPRLFQSEKYFCRCSFCAFFLFIM